MNRLIIIGASGHGKVIANIAKLCGYEDIVFLDDDENKKTCAGYPVVGSSKEAPEGDIFVAIGDMNSRKRLMEAFKDRNQPVLIHPSAVIADNVEIGKGSVIMPGTVINPDVKIGCGTIINTCSSVDHESRVGNYVHIAVGAHLCGNVSVGENSHIGAGSTIINNISICPDCIIGAGAVVNRDITVPGTYVGVPAHQLRG